MIKTKEQEREKLLVEIEREIQVMRADKIVVIKEKEEEVNAIREKLTAACRKIEEYARNESSGSNLTS